MDKAFDLFKMDNDLEYYYSIKPVLTDTQWQLLDCFYSARRDCAVDSRIKKQELFDAVKSIIYESDIAVNILQKLDDFYLELRAKKIKGQTKP